MDILYSLYEIFNNFINSWWPWLNIWNDIFLIQFFILSTYFYININNNVYFALLYTFINFFLIGIYLSLFQIELFTAFLWLVECSVLFVFLLLLFYLNVKGTYKYTYSNFYSNFFTLIFLLILFNLNNYSVLDLNQILEISFYGIIDNYYEALFNSVMNDLFGFSISYYLINSIEFIFIGFLLLIGSVVCVNLYQMNKNIRSQNYNNFLSIFNFFLDFSNFLFLRKQNLTKQGNTKPSLKIFKKK